MNRLLDSRSSPHHPHYEDQLPWSTPFISLEHNPSTIRTKRRLHEAKCLNHLSTQVKSILNQIKSHEICWYTSTPPLLTTRLNKSSHRKPAPPDRCQAVFTNSTDFIQLFGSKPKLLPSACAVARDPGDADCSTVSLQHRPDGH